MCLSVFVEQQLFHGFERISTRKDFGARRVDWHIRSHVLPICKLLCILELLQVPCSRKKPFFCNNSTNMVEAAGHK